MRDFSKGQNTLETAQPARSSSAALTLSVIVPVYRESAALADLLRALDEQVGMTARGWEVIVVDNDPCGPDHFGNLPKVSFRLRIVGCATPGSYAARNAGATAAAGACLVFTDADCRPSSGWLAAIQRGLEERPNTILAGPVLLEPGTNPNDWAIFDTVRGIPQGDFISRGYAATANLACTRRLFDQIGGFAEDRLSGGDAEFCRRAVRQGIKLHLVADALVHHPARATDSALIIKARRIKGGQLAAGPVLHRALWTLRSLTPPLREIFTYMRAPYSWNWRLIACRKRMYLWGVELTEMVRLLILRAPPERR